MTAQDPSNAPADRLPIPGRFDGILRDFSPEDVQKLSGSVRVRHTLAERGADKLWRLLHERDHVHALGALTGNQAMQMVKGGLEAIYLSGWQVAADANVAGHMYPDQSLYPANSVPEVVRKINRTLARADQIAHSEGDNSIDFFAPIVADAEAGFGGPLNAFELMKAMIEAGAAGVHFEDQLASEKKCGHLGGKVLVPTSQFIRTLNAARLAADVSGVDTVLVARTDSHAAGLITSDIDERDHPFLTGQHTQRASAHPRASSTRSPASPPPSPAASPTPTTRTSSGARPRPPTSPRRESSRRPSTRSTPTSSSPTTARPPSTGRRT